MEFQFAMCIRSFLASNLLVILFSRIGVLHMYSCFSSSCMFKVQNKSPICVFTAHMFATLSTTFELPFYTNDHAHLLAEPPSPPPNRTHLFNKLVLDFLNIEAKQGDDSDRHGSPSC